MRNIIDLHCDLLYYLQVDPKRSPDDPASRASYPQLQAGGVRLQILAIAAVTGPSSSRCGKAQVDIYKHLPSRYPSSFAHLETLDTPHVNILAAFENASAFAEEGEPLAACLARLEQYVNELGKILYITMTWNGENRFGGGVGALCGLKSDGKRLLDWMGGKNIAIDMSHTSDKLAEEILSHIDNQRLDLPVIASHSNFRAITHHPRNLPDWLAQEIISRKGLIGINFFPPFVRTGDPEVLARHVEYGLSLGGKDALCFGADFFGDLDFPDLIEKYQTDVAFFPEFPNSSCYPKVLDLLQQKLKLSESQLDQLASENVTAFLIGKSLMRQV